jgi:VWFA-related protein
MRAPGALALLVTVGVVTPVLEPPERKPVFPAETELVTVDAVVIDPEGAPVTGLRASDFSLSEDGVRQEIVAFEAVDRPAPPEAPGPASAEPEALPPVSSNRAASARPARAFVVVFDDLHLGVAEAVRAGDAVAALLRSTADGDRVTLVATGGSSWWHARMPEGRDGLLKIAGRLRGRARTAELTTEPMTDQEAMRIARDGDPLVFGHVVRRWRAAATDVLSYREADTIPDQVRTAAARISLDVERRSQETLEVLVRAIASLAEVRGRKSVLLVSEGFVHDPHLAGFREVVAESRRANAAVYFVDARGLVALGPDFTAEARAPTDIQDVSLSLGALGAGSEGSESLAEDTGGFSVKNRNDLATGVRAIVRESSSYYLLGYAPPPRSRGGFRRIEVKVAREGVRVRARRGYYATTSRDRTRPRDAALQRALDSPFDLEGIPLRATAHVFGPKPRGEGRVLITTEVDVRALDLREEGGSSVDTLEVRLVAAHRETGALHRGDQRVALKLRPEARERVFRTWLPITSEATLAPGRYQARVVVVDANNGRAGSVSHDFDVPSLEGLRISTPVLSDRLREAPGTGPELIARRTLAPTGVLHCRFEVYGAAKDPATGHPAVSAAFAVRRADGTLVAAADATRITPGADGILARTVGVPLDRAPEGPYEMIVTVEDEISGRTAEVREAFVVDSSGGS